jgi:hypothetical protein
MIRGFTMTRISLTLLLTATAAVVTTRPTQAQYYAGLYNNYFNGYNTSGGGFIPGLHINNPYTGQSFNYNYTSNVYLGADYINPYTGNRNYFYYNRTISGLALPGSAFSSLYARPYAGYQANPYGVGGYLGGGIGGFGGGGAAPGNNPVVQEQIRMLKAAAVKNNARANDIEARKVIADQWAYEQRSKVKVPVTAAGAAFRDTPEEEVLSGRGLNDLAAAIRRIDVSGKPAPLLTANLLGHVAYARGPAADVIGLAAAGKLDYPPSLAGRDWLALRTDLDKVASPVLEAAAAGKPVPSSAADALAAQVKRSREEAAPLMRSVSFADAETLSRFFTGVAQLARLGSDAGLKNAYVPDWGTVGASVKEFADHLGKYDLAVGHARPGDEEAYYALHRAMLEYFNTLAAK